MKSDLRFFVQLLILTFVIAAVGTALFLTLIKEYYLPVFPFLLAFFAVMTYFINWLMARSLMKNPEKFTYVFMGLSGGKLILMLLMIVTYLIIRRETVISFLAGTFLLYLVFTIFEVKTLLRMVQGKQ